MAPRRDLLRAMRDAPAGDWTMRDVEAVCARHGLRCSPPRGGGSHFKVSHPSLAEILTIPARRPIKPVYIRKLAALVAALGGADARD